MQGVLYAAVAAAFLLGVLFVLAYHRRGTAAAPGDDTSARSAREEAESTRRLAEAEAASIRQLAERESESQRRAAAAEADALRRALDAQVSEALAEARRAGEAEAARLTESARAADREAERRTSELESLRQRLDADRQRLDADRLDLDRRMRELAEQGTQLTARRAELDVLEAQIAERLAEADRIAAERQRELERVSALTSEDAKAELLASVETSARREAAVLVRTIENEARAEAGERARAIVVEAVERVASEQTTETVVSVLPLPGDDMKGRIIGREGRNIRAFESVTGVNVIIDDTPEAVLLSCFDPVRREVGRLTLEKLVLDGRIHPHRIEEIYETSKAEVEQLCIRAARDALAEIGIGDLDEHLVPILGRLKYRTSYGQNVLGHLKETAHIAGIMAAELGIEPTLVKRCAFLHDIGKALTHEVEGSHAIIGADLLRKYGEDEAVAHAVEAHHNEVAPRTVEAVLTQASDTCSAARPGARRESLENYVKRLARIEEIAQAKTGVEKVFAMLSGREVRVMVQPSEVDDLAAQVLAREIAKQIEDELTYPGQIRVTVVRESRATEIAH
jgi:ribonuclease Y